MRKSRIAKTEIIKAKIGTAGKNGVYTNTTDAVKVAKGVSVSVITTEPT